MTSEGFNTWKIQNSLNTALPGTSQFWKAVVPLTMTASWKLKLKLKLKFKLSTKETSEKLFWLFRWLLKISKQTEKITILASVWDVQPSWPNPGGRFTFLLSESKITPPKTNDHKADVAGSKAFLLLWWGIPLVLKHLPKTLNIYKGKIFDHWLHSESINYFSYIANSPREKMRVMSEYSSGSR